MPASSVGFTMHLPDMLLALGIALLSLLLLMNLRFRLARRGTDRTPATGRSHGSSAEPRAESAIRNPAHRSSAVLSDSLVDIFDVAKELLAQIETRSRTLEVLICQADDRLKKLDQAIDDHVGASISPGKAAAGDATPPCGHDAEALGTATRIGRIPFQYGTLSQRSSENNQSGGNHSQSNGVSKMRSANTGDADAPQPVEPLLVNVYELADRGQSVVEIARNLDEQIGKVELILALRQ